MKRKDAQDGEWMPKDGKRVPKRAKTNTDKETREDAHAQIILKQILD